MTTTQLHKSLTSPRTCTRCRQTIPRGATALYAHYAGYRPAESYHWPVCPPTPPTPDVGRVSIPDETREGAR